MRERTEPHRVLAHSGDAPSCIPLFDRCQLSMQKRNRSNQQAIGESQRGRP